MNFDTNHSPRAGSFVRPVGPQTAPYHCLLYTLPPTPVSTTTTRPSIPRQSLSLSFKQYANTIRPEWKYYPQIYCNALITAYNILFTYSYFNYTLWCNNISTKQFQMSLDNKKDTVGTHILTNAIYRVTFYCDPDEYTAIL